MKKATGVWTKAMKQGVRNAIATTLLLLGLCVLCHTGSAQSDPTQAEVHDKSLKSYKLPPNLKKHLQEKYKDQIYEVSSNIQETPQGPRGTLNISGHIKQKKFETTSGDKAGRVRAHANAFLKDESELLGLLDLNELREYKIATTMGHDGEYTDIYYARYIDDLHFENAMVHITIGPDESIMFVTAVLVPASSELYNAVTKKMITENEVSKIIERDLKAHGFEPEDVAISNVNKSALSTSPYVVWTAAVDLKNLKKKHDMPAWGYEINAFSGEILHKSDIRIKN
jgi:hypothetical protein